MDIFIYLFVAVVILIGFAGTIIPVLPGTPVIFLGILVYTFFYGFEDITVTTLIFLGIIAALAQLFDYLAGVYGAKKLGSTKWGILGSIAGGIFGLIVLNIVGLVLGTFLGAALAEMVFAKKSLHHSFKVGLGSVLGFLGGVILKLILGIVMIGIFLFRLIS